MNKRWINTKVEFIWDGTQYVEQSVDGYWYDGEMALCDGAGTIQSGTGVQWGDVYTTNNATAGIRMIRSGTPNGDWSIANAASTLTFKVDNNINSSDAHNGTTVFSMTDSSTNPLAYFKGSVGIGATSPDALLHIKKAASGVMPAMHLERTGAMNHYIGYDTDNKLVIGENVDMVSTVRMAIDTNGNVGIGQTTPAASDGSARTLHIGSNLIIQDVVGNQTMFANNAHYDGTWKQFADGENAIAMRFSPSGRISFHIASELSAGATLSNWDNTDIKMIINSSGNIGLGTTTPAASDGSARTLQLGDNFVIQNVVGSQGMIANNAHYDGAWKQVAADPAPSAVRFYSGNIGFHCAADAGDAGATLSTWDNTDIKMYIVGSTGNIGIGTSDPVSPLNIKSNTTNDVESGFTFTANADTTTLANLYEGNTKDGILQLHDDGVVKIRLCTAGDSHFSGGNVGIGTSSPAALMHTYGSSNTAAKFESTDANCNIIITDSGGSGINIKAVGDVATISTGDTMAMTIDASQNVGIGDSSPSYKLEVAGTFYASGSSQAFKKNVTDLAVDSSAIYNLNPVSYNYKKDYENFGYDLAEGKQFGLISEEVAEAVPELAIMKDGEPKNVDYQKLSVLLLAEMQKMNKRIKDLECHI